MLTTAVRKSGPVVVLMLLVLLGPDRTGEARAVQLFAHRGVCVEHPENSLAAVKAALDLGLLGTEIDLRTTRDGSLVLMHDPTVDRTTDGRGLIKEMDLARVKKLRLKDKQGRITREPPPTLAQVLELAATRPGFELALDLKEVDPAQVARKVAASGIKDRVIFSIDDPQKVGTIRAVREVDPELKISVDLLTWWKIEGLPSFAAKALEAQALFASEWFFPRWGFAEAREAGARVMVFLWGEHDLLSRAKRAADLGAQVISSDRPDLLLELAL